MTLSRPHGWEVAFTGLEAFRGAPPELGISLARKKYKKCLWWTLTLFYRRERVPLQAELKQWKTLAGTGVRCVLQTV